MGLARDFTKTIDPTRRGLWAVSDSVKNHKRHKVQVASSAAVSRSVGLSDVGMRPRVDELACISTHGREGRRRDLSVSTAAPRLALTGDAGWGWGEGGGDASRGAAYRQAGQSGRQAGRPIRQAGRPNRHAKLYARMHTVFETNSPKTAFVLQHWNRSSKIH